MGRMKKKKLVSSDGGVNHRSVASGCTPDRNVGKENKGRVDVIYSPEYNTIKFLKNELNNNRNDLNLIGLIQELEQQ